jgi:hypothetical protein
MVIGEPFHEFLSALQQAVPVVDNPVHVNDKGRFRPDMG